MAAASRKTGPQRVIAGDPTVDVRAVAGRMAIQAFRYPKGVSGNPRGLDRAYREARRLARTTSPAIMAALTKMALDEQEDPRVRAVCGFGVLDRAGLKPIDYQEFLAEEKAADWGRMPAFNPRDYTPEELDVIDAALRLVIAKRDQKKQTRGEPTARDTETGVPIEAEVVEDGERE